MTKSRKVLKKDSKGKCRRSLMDSKICNTKPCPCVLSAWGAWGACDAKCGAGNTTRTRTVVKKDSNGKCLRSLTDSSSCDNGPCPCVLSPWSPWGACDAKCGAGNTTRTRKVVKKDSNGKCLRSLTGTKSCSSKPCPCVLSAWSPWGSCDAKCGPGNMTRTRTVMKKDSNGKCLRSLTGTKSCSGSDCPCKLSSWGKWGACSATCGPGQQTKSRKVLKRRTKDGKKMKCIRPLNATKSCYGHVCPCVLSAWSPWGPCDAKCGGGKITRARTVVKKDSKGKCLRSLTDSKTCNTKPCPCVLSAWGAWSACDAKCGGGKMTRARTVVKNVSEGKCLRSLTDSKTCNISGCPNWACLFAIVFFVVYKLVMVGAMNLQRYSFRVESEEKPWWEQTLCLAGWSLTLVARFAILLPAMSMSMGNCEFGFRGILPWGTLGIFVASIISFGDLETAPMNWTSPLITFIMTAFTMLSAWAFMSDPSPALITPYKTEYLATGFVAIVVVSFILILVFMCTQEKMLADANRNFKQVMSQAQSAALMTASSGFLVGISSGISIPLMAATGRVANSVYHQAGVVAVLESGLLWSLAIPTLLTLIFYYYYTPACLKFCKVKTFAVAEQQSEAFISVVAYLLLNERYEHMPVIWLVVLIIGLMCALVLCAIFLFMESVLEEPEPEPEQAPLMPAASAPPPPSPEPTKKASQGAFCCAPKKDKKNPTKNDRFTSGNQV